MRERMKKGLAMLLVGSLLQVSIFTNFFTVSVASSQKLENPIIDANEVTTWDTIWFGHYWQTDTNGDGSANEEDEKEPIKWRVLSVDGNEAFLLADKCLDTQSYNSEGESTGWGDCTLRTWLNTTFENNAFSLAESEMIKESIVENCGETNGYAINEENTNDKIYLLSTLESCNEDYGFSGNFREMSATRKAYNTAYAAGKEGAWNSNGNEGTWYMRTATQYWIIQSVANVSYGGQGVYYDGMHSRTNLSSIRPAIRIDLSNTGLWSYAGTVNSNGEMDVPPVPHKNGAITVNTPLKDTVTTYDLLKKYPEYLDQSPQERVMTMLYEDCVETNGNRTYAENKWASWKYLLSGKVIESSIKEIFIGTEGMTEEYVDESILKLMKELGEQTDVLDSIIKEVQKEYKWAKTIKDSGKHLSASEVEDMLKKGKRYSQKDIERLMKELGKNWEDIDKQFKKVGYAIDIGEAAVAVATLESIQENLVKTLLDVVSEYCPGSELESGLKRILEEVRHPYKAVVSKYIEEKVFEIMGKWVAEQGTSIIDMMGYGGSSGLVFCAKLVCKGISYIMPGASADDVIKAQIETSLYYNLERAMTRQMTALINNKVNQGNLDINEEIDKNELLYKTKVEMMKIAIGSCQKVAKGYLTDALERDKDIIKKVSYKEHIKGCKAKVTETLNAKYKYSVKDKTDLQVSGFVETQSKQGLMSVEEDKETTEDEVDNTILMIPDVVREMPVTAIKREAFKGNTTIKYLYVPEGVTEIEASAFENCTELQRVYLPETVKLVGEKAFAGCSALEYIECSSAIMEEDELTQTTATIQPLEKAIKEISLHKSPDSTEFATEEDVVDKGMELKVIYEDGTEEIVTKDWYSILGERADDKATVYVSYGGKLLEYEVSYTEPAAIPYQIVCQDDMGVRVSEIVYKSAIQGDSITVEAPEVDGYQLSSATKEQTIVADSPNQQIIFEYQQITENNLKNAETELDCSSFAYTGNAIVPEVSMTIGNKQLIEGIDYEVLAINNSMPGIGTLLICGLGDYDGITSMEFMIQEPSEPTPTPTPSTNRSPSPTLSETPRGQQLASPTQTVTVPEENTNMVPAPSKVKSLKVKAKKRSARLKWKRVAGAKGYQVQYAQNKKFTKKKKVILIQNGKAKVTIKKLKKAKKYCFRVRAYKLDGKKKVYGKWSVAKKVKVK